MAFSVVDAGPEYLSQMEELEKQCFSLPWTREQLEHQISGENQLCLLAVEEEGLLGYVGMMYVLDEGYISNVAVAPARRRQGIGDALISELLRRAEDLRLSFVTLEVRESNEAAVNLYGKHGFRAVGLRKNYYDLPKENAVLMTCFLK